MAMTPYQKAIKKLVGIRQPDPLGTGVKTTTGAAAGESVKPAAGGVTSGASPSILPGTPGQGAVTKPVGTPGQAQVTNLPQQKNAYQQAVDAATPTDRQYTSFYKPPEGFGAMSADDQAVWNGIGQKYTAGDNGWMQDTNQFRDNGNWGSFKDTNGNINGWLQVHDGSGGFTPVFGGRLGETGYAPGTVFSAPDGTAYVVGDDGTLKASGTMNYAKYGEYIGPRDGSLHGTFRASDGKTYDYDSLTPEQAAMFGLVNSEGGGARVGSVPEMTDQALAQGATTPEIAALVREDERAKAMGLPMPGASASGGEGSLGGFGTGRTPGYRGMPEGNAQTTQERTPYQAYMDQWDYPAAPEWEGTEYQAKRDAALEAAGEKWTPSEYQQKRDDALSRAEQMQWNYDPNTDPVWQAYQKQYRREGQRATQDTLGKYAQLTGGQPSSYAATAAAQAGNYYASQLSDKLPELYQDAYNRYLQEFQRQLGISDQYQGFDDREYSRWADQQGRNFDVADRYNQYGEQDYDKYRDRLSQYNTDRNFSYGQYRDAVGDYRYDDETAYNRNYQAQRDAINDQRYDQEWAQQLREYADSQNWKAKDWEQYLREYEDKLSNQEREWAYQMSRDAVRDARYNQEYADSRADTAYSRALADEERAYNRAWNEDERDYERGWDTTKWNQALREYDDDQAQQAWNNEYKMSGKTSASGGSSSKSTGGTKTPSSNLPSGQYQQNGYTYLSGKTHPDGQPMTAMYDQAYQDTWNKWQSGLDYGVLLKEIANLTTSKTITDAEGQMILRDLQSWRAQGRNREASAGGGGSSQWTQMTR